MPDPAAEPTPSPTRTLEKTRARVDELHVHPRNPRRIAPARLEQLQRTLEAEPGMLEARPLIALPDGTVVAGNQRLLAARALGWETIPVVYADLTPEEITRWMLLDNRSFGDDDPFAVAELLAELEVADSDLDLTGYQSSEVDQMLRDLRRSDADPDVAPPVPVEPVSRLGEMYELGRHRLKCGDSREIDLPDGAVITDPPYGVGYQYETWDDDDAAVNDGLYAWLESLERTPTIYFCGSVNLKRELLRGPAKVLIWHKPWSMTHSGIGNGRHHWEPIIARRLATGVYLATDVLVEMTDRVPGLRDEHSCPKPVALLASLIAGLVPDRETLILDPFAGAGTTMIACEMLDRSAFLSEIDPGYCDVIRQRYADYTNQPQYAP